MTTSALTAALQELDSLIQQQQWPEARAAADALVAKAPTTPGVIERAMLVLRQLEDWRALTGLLLEARNKYQLWPLGSDLLMGQGMVELSQWAQAVPYLELALSQEVDGGWPHHFLGKALRHSGRLEEALEQQRLAAEQLPDFAWAPFEAAQVLMELEQPRLAVLELQEARRRHGAPNDVIEEQWQKLQPLVLLNRVEQLQTAGSITEAFAVLRQAMAHAPEDEALGAKLIELLAAQVEPADGSAVDSKVDVNALEQELNQIEALLDEMEAQASYQPPAATAVPALADGEMSYL